MIESLLRTDAPLSLRVLRAANSAAYATWQIASVRQALVLIGLERLRSWLLLMVLSDASGASGERLETAITRAGRASWSPAAAGWPIPTPHS